MDKITKDQLLKYLRDALRRLHDPVHLRHSPLAVLFGVADRSDTPSTLRRILTEAIESLEPDSTMSPESRAWRLYDAVYYRYVEAYSQEEVAQQLGMSSRQLRREQHAALELLCDRLWEEYGLDAAWPEQSEPMDGGSEAAPAPSFRRELAWLQEPAAGAATDPKETLEASIALVRRLAAQQRVEVGVATSDDLPLVAADGVALRQTLLSLLSYAIVRAGPEGTVRVFSRRRDDAVEIQVESTKGPSQQSEARDSAGATNLEVALRLAQMSGGHLSHKQGGQSFCGTLCYPALRPVTVLVIDDNPGTQHLLKRYAAGTRYHLTTTSDPDEAVRLAEELQPQAIVLDVMMPLVDGWEVLGRLRQHPATCNAPIIVCTILAQEELAYSLGASAFLRKPVTRRAFLSALERQIAPTETGSR